MAKKQTKKEQYSINWADVEKHRLWCFRKGYKIYPITKDNQNYKIAIELGVKKAVLSTEWQKKYMHYAVADAYKIVYEKHNL